MHYSDDRYHLHVQLESKHCQVPADELTRMQQSLQPLGEAVQDFPTSDLRITIIHHARSALYHVEAKLKLPGQTLFTGEQDAYLDSAFQRCVQKLVRKVETYKDRPDRKAIETAARRAALRREVVVPTDADTGVLGKAVQTGDYRRFRTALAGYEEWLRNRVGRWVQRYPEAQARVGHGLALGDLVEEVYLNAFDRYALRPAGVPLHDWLDGLIDPSLKVLLRHPEEERENASMARTVREAPLG